MNTTKEEPRVMFSELSRKFYLVRSFYKDGRAKEKYDVTEIINQQVLQALIEVKSKAFITVGGAKVISPADVQQIEEKYR